MARDETVREPDAERPLLDRRAYLRLAGVAAVSVAVAGVSESVDAAGPAPAPADQSLSPESGRDDRPGRFDEGSENVANE